MQPCHSSSSVLAKAPATVENSNSIRSMIWRSRVSSPRRTGGAIDLVRTRRRSVASARDPISSPAWGPSPPPSHIPVVYTALCISSQPDTTPANPRHPKGRANATHATDRPPGRSARISWPAPQPRPAPGQHAPLPPAEPGSHPAATRPSPRPASSRPRTRT